MTRVICVEQKQRKLTMDKKENSNLELEVVAVLRSVVQSAKGGVLVKNLHSEYALLVGEKVPFKALGYSSLEEMLRSMPDIVKISRNSHGEYIVNAVADESTAHIASLISRQKNPKTNPKRVQRRRPMTMSRYSKPQASQYSPRMNAKKQPSTNFSSRAPRDMQNVTLSKTTSDGQPSIPQKAFFNRRKPTTQHPNIPPRFLAHSFTSQSFGQASATPANFLLKQPLPSSPPPLSPPATPPPLQHLSSPLSSRTSASLLTSSVSLPPRLISSVSPPPLTTSVSPPPLTSSVSPPPLYCPSSSILDLVERDTSYLSYHDLVSCRDIIDLYAADKGLKVTYRSLPLNPKEVPRTYLSTLMIAKQMFNSYPKDMPTIELAEEEAARVAVESLNILADPESQSLPTSSVDTMEHKKIILKRISKIIQDYTNGLWSMKVESVYKETYNEVLPSDWLDVISSDIKITQVAQKGSILYPSLKNSPLENNDDVPARQETSLPDSLPLPDSEYWDVFVSYLTSSVDVCIQLVDHSESFQSLVQKMQTCYENNGIVAKKIEDGNLYAIYNEKYWHRIHVTNIMGDKVECYFVDYGDSCITDSNCLYELMPEFATLPFQALHCQLDGLVEYAENKIMLHHLTDKNLLLGKTLVAKVINKDDPISLVFYDTTTDENININEHLVKITEKDYITPKLPKVGGITKAYLSHVDRNGDVYMRVSGSALDLLKNLMDEFSNQINMEAVKCMSNDKMYCINYIDNWYRAIVKVFPVGDAYKEVEMLCVDYGNCVTVSITNIYELGQLSDELTGLPFQALKCRLHGISPAENEEWSKQTIQQLLKLAPENQVLLLKVITAATENIATSVELFKRIEPNDELVSINETIAMSNHSIISIKENSTESNNILRNNKMDGHCFKPSDLRLNFEEAVSPLTSTNNSGCGTPLQEENKLSKHYSVITPDGFGEQVDDVFELPSLIQSTIPEIGNYFDVHVINAAHPFNFTCQPYKEGSQLEELSKEMQLFYSSEDNTIDMEKCLLRVGQFYAGKNEKNEWCRVCVKNIFEDDDMVSTYFIDYGGYAVVGLSDLQPLWKYFRTLPFQAIRSRLYGIEPVHSDWGINDCVEFKKLVEKREFVSVIKEKKLDKTSNAVQELSLTLIDTSGKDDVYINQLLISRKIAVQTTKR